MEKNKLDHIIRTKLEGFQPPFHPEHWEALSSRLDGGGSPASDDASMDQLIFQKLHKFEPATASPKGWAQMAARLDEEYGTLETLYRHKAMEGFLLLFGLLLFVLLTPPDSFPTAVQRPFPLPERTEFTPVSPLPTQQLDVVECRKEENLQPLTPQSLFKLPEQEGGPTSPEEHAEHLFPEENEALSPSFDHGGPVKEEQKTKAYPDLHVSMLDRIDQSLLVTPAEEVIGLAKSPKSNGTDWNLSMFGAADVNLVMTPPNADYKVRASNRLSYGYGAGLSVGLATNSGWEFGAGLVYTAKQYRPQQNIILSGSLTEGGFTGEQLNGFEFNMINIPLYLRRNLIDDSKWRVYGVAGASLQVAYEATYFVGAPNPKNLPNGQELRRTPAADSRIDNISGFFQGGSFSENSYLTANLSLGLERSFDQRWSLFLQPTYQHSFGYFSAGLGPHRDRINTMSIMSGVRVRLQE